MKKTFCKLPALLCAAALIMQLLTSCAAQKPAADKDENSQGEQQTETGGEIYAYQGYASKTEYPMDENSLDYAAQRFRYLYDSYMADKDVKLYLSVIPDKNQFMAEQSGRDAIDFDAFTSSLREKTDYMQYIDISDLLELSDYYRTDMHWSQEKLTDVASRIAGEMGAAADAEYSEKTLSEPLRGIYCEQEEELESDPVVYLTNDTIEESTVFNFESNGYMDVYDMEKAAGDAPYDMFLGGSRSLLTIENPNAVSDKELVIFRDSFGSSLAPLLIEGYSRITLVDIRYLASSFVGNFIEFDNQDVLFIFSVQVLNNSVTMK